MSVLSFIVIAIFIIEISFYFYLAVKVDSPKGIRIIYYLSLYGLSIIFLFISDIISDSISIIIMLDILLALFYINELVLYFKLNKKH